MNKPKLNDPDVEITTTTIGESITIPQFEDIFVTDTKKVEEIYPTLEQVKKEWEELGYEIYQEKNYIAMKNKTKKMEIIIKFNGKYYYKRDNDNFWETITFQEHQLLTKTFKALGWI